MVLINTLFQHNKVADKTIKIPVPKVKLHKRDWVIE